MKTNFKLVAGSVAGMLSVVGLVVGLLAWATTEEASSSTALVGATTEGSPESGDEIAAPLPIPSLDNELATTHRASTLSAVPEPALVEESDPFEPDLDTLAPVRVRRLVVSSGVSRHEPTGAADTFRIGAQRRLYAFVDAVNDTDEDASLEVTFEPETGESSGHVSLDVPADRARFRTWAYTRHIYAPGRWQVVVRSADGAVVARRAFDVVE